MNSQILRVDSRRNEASVPGLFDITERYSRSLTSARVRMGEPLPPAYTPVNRVVRWAELDRLRGLISVAILAVVGGLGLLLGRRLGRKSHMASSPEDFASKAA